GIVDRLAQGPDSLLDEACGFARQLLDDAAPAQPRPTHAQPGAGLPSSFFSDYRARHAPRWKGQQAPQRVLDAVQAACELPLAAGLRHESELFREAEASAESAALRHLFFAEREAGKIPGVDGCTELRSIAKIAVIGAGTMGGGI